MSEKIIGSWMLMFLIIEKHLNINGNVYTKLFNNISTKVSLDIITLFSNSFTNIEFNQFYTNFSVKKYGLGLYLQNYKNNIKNIKDIFYQIYNYNKNLGDSNKYITNLIHTNDDLSLLIKNINNSNTEYLNFFSKKIQEYINLKKLLDNISQNKKNNLIKYINDEKIKLLRNIK